MMVLPTRIHTPYSTINHAKVEKLITFLKSFYTMYNNVLSINQWLILGNNDQPVYWIWTNIVLELNDAEIIFIILNDFSKLLILKSSKFKLVPIDIKFN